MTEMIMPFPQEQCEVSQTSMVYNCYDVYIDEEIKEPSHYRQVLQVLRTAQEGDLVRLFISSPGGNMHSASMLINAIHDCRGDVEAIIEAECHSASSLLALSCPSIRVMPYASMMCHSASFGSWGSVQNVRDHVGFVGTQAESLMDEIYQDYLSEQELIDLKHGREIWLNHEEIGERLQNMFLKRQERYENEMEKACLEQEDELDTIVNEAVEEATLSLQAEINSLKAQLAKKPTSKPAKKTPTKQA